MKKKKCFDYSFGFDERTHVKTKMLSELYRETETKEFDYSFGFDERKVVKTKLLSELYRDDETKKGPGINKTRGCAGKAPMLERKTTDREELVAWGSRALINFLESIDVDVRQVLPQAVVTARVKDYAKKKKLFDPDKKATIICDEKLQTLLGLKTVIEDEIFDYLVPHFDEKQLLSGKYAAIDPKNMCLVYLKKSLIEKLGQEAMQTFHEKVTGSFVKFKLDPEDRLLENTHKLLQVRGTSRIIEGGTVCQTLLKVFGMENYINVSLLSDSDITKDECEELKVRIQSGLIKQPTVDELEHKARSLHEDITKHWIATQLNLLQMHVDRAMEEGRSKESDEYSAKRQLLQKSSEQEKLLNRIPRVAAAAQGELELISKDAKALKQGDQSSAKLACMGSSETPCNRSDGNKIISVAPVRTVFGDAEKVIADKVVDLPESKRNIKRLLTTMNLDKYEFLKPGVGLTPKKKPPMPRNTRATKKAKAKKPPIESMSRSTKRGVIPFTEDEDKLVGTEAIQTNPSGFMADVRQRPGAGNVKEPTIKKPRVEAVPTPRVTPQTGLAPPAAPNAVAKAYAKLGRAHVSESEIIAWSSPSYEENNAAITKLLSEAFFRQASHHRDIKDLAFAKDKAEKELNFWKFKAEQAVDDNQKLVKAYKRELNMKTQSLREKLRETKQKLKESESRIATLESVHQMKIDEANPPA